MTGSNSDNAVQGEGSSVYAWLTRVQKSGTPQAKRAAQVLKDYYEGVDTDELADVMAGMEAAREQAYPIPDSPHASVTERNSIERIAYERGYRDRAASHAQVVSIPQGYRLVPEVLTDDMTVAFAEAWYSKVRCIDDCEMEDCYEALLAVAPSPPVQVRIVYPGYLAEPRGALEVVGYQMLGSPKVFYEAGFKPTDINNFRTVFALREVPRAELAAEESELFQQLEALAADYEQKRLREVGGNAALARVHQGMRAGLSLAATLVGALSSSPHPVATAAGVPTEPVTKPLQLKLAVAVIDKLWRETMETAPAPAYRYFAQLAVSAAAAPAPLVNEDLCRLARKEALLVYESMPMGRADSVLVGYGRAVLKAAGVNVEVVPAATVPV